MVKRLIDTDRDWVSVLLRVTLALVIFPHGAQKLLGWFGGAGFGPTLDYFAEALGIPPALTVLVIGLEFFGPIALILGLGSRVAALGIAAVMLGAVFTVHLSNGFFMNWAGAQAGEGFEYHLLALAIAAVVALKGSGGLSLDRRLAARRA